MIAALAALAGPGAVSASPERAAATPVERAASYLASRQQPEGGFAERGAASSPGLSAWVALGLEAAGHEPADPQLAAAFLSRAPAPQATDLELRLLALSALGQDTAALADSLERLRGSSGRIGPAWNSTYWGAIALEAAGREPGGKVVHFILVVQRPSGGWSWNRGTAADAGDTAAAIQALRAAGVGARATAIKRGIAFLRRCQNRDGGFGVSPGTASDAQSTAWAIQALVAARVAPGNRAFAYLKRLQRPDGSFRYSTRYATTPAWVTAQVLCALARRPFPL